jgi:hypothetical protein
MRAIQLAIHGEHTISLAEVSEIETQLVPELPFLGRRCFKTLPKQRSLEIGHSHASHTFLLTAYRTSENLN